MSDGYTWNHYVPQWYQRRFIPRDANPRKLYLLDLRPEVFKDSRGNKHRDKAVRRRGPRGCFAIDDLYTTRIRGAKSHDLERKFFGSVDEGGKRAVESLSRFDHNAVDRRAVTQLMRFLSTQKLRTPKGLDWLRERTGARRRRDVLSALSVLQRAYGAIWTECVWQLADASGSPTKFIVSDHPVTVYNRACAPGNPLWCKGPNDPDIRLEGTHTLFPLSMDRILILTNRSWACNPHQPPTVVRPNYGLFRGSTFNFMDIQCERSLAELDVIAINHIIKARAYRFLAAGREEWLYPERRLSNAPWRRFGDDHLLMPDPRSIIPGYEMILGYADGSTESIDSHGRLPGDPEFGHEARAEDGIQAHSRWKADFEQLFGPEPRGMTWEERNRVRQLSPPGRSPSALLRDAA